MQTIADPQGYTQSSAFDTDGRLSTETIPISAATSTLPAVTWMTAHTYVPPNTIGAGQKYQTIGAYGSSLQQAGETYLSFPQENCD